MTNLTTAPTIEKPASSTTTQAAGAILHLAMRSAQELTHLVAEMHSTITYLPSPLNKEHQANAPSEQLNQKKKLA